MSKEMCAKKFQKTFDAYFRNWWIVGGGIYVLAFSLFFVPMLVRATNSELSSFICSIVNFGFDPEMGQSTFGFITIGIISVGAVTVGVVAIGACSAGVIAVGAGSVGVFSFGAFSVGIFAFGSQAVGMVAIGSVAYGQYTLSSSGRGRYMFSLNRQDEEAVALFTRWLPKFSDVFSPSSAGPKSR